MARQGAARQGGAGLGTRQGYHLVNFGEADKGEMMDKKSGIFGGGVPTDIDLRLLKDAFPVDKMAVGQLMPYAKVAAAIRCEVGSCRYRTVTNRWRKTIESEHGIIIGTKSGEGFIVLDDHEKLDVSSSKLRSSRRFARRSLQVAAKIDRKMLSAPELSTLDINTLRAASITATAQIRKALDIPSLG
jgi:hypothetical protein